MLKLDFSKIAHLFTLILVILLVLASKGFLISHPFLSASVLILFSVLYLVISLHLNSVFFVYPSIALFVLSYFLATYHINPYPYHAPLLSVTLIGLFLFLALKHSKKKFINAPLMNSSYILITAFTIYIIYYANHFVQADQIVPIISLTFFASVLGILSIKKKKNFLIYWGLITVSLAFLFLLYSFVSVPIWHFSLYLMVFFVCMMHLGTIVHREAGLINARPFYWIGFLGLGIAPLYSVHHNNILLILQALYALHFWEIYIEIKKIEPDYKKKTFLGQILNIMVYPLTIVSISLIIQEHFPITLNTIGTSLVFAFLYFKMAHENRLKWKKIDLHLLIFGVAFLTIAYFAMVFLFLNPLANPSAFLAFLPLIWLLLLGGRLYSKEEGNRLYIGIYRIQYLPMIVVLVLPLFLKRINIPILLSLDILFLLTYILIYLKERWIGFLYSIPIAFSYLYYLYLVKHMIPNTYFSVCLLFPGLAVLFLALWLQAKGSKWKHIFYFWWYILSAMALVLLNVSPVYNYYVLYLWGLMYLFTGIFVKGLSERHKAYLLTTGNTLSIATALIISVSRNLTNITFLYFLIGICYLIIYLINKNKNYLYPIAISAVVSYSLFFLWEIGWDFAHLGIIPLLFLLYGIWDFFEIKQMGNQGMPLKRVGHLTAIFYTAMLLFNISRVGTGITLISLTIYFLLYLLISMIHKWYDIIFLTFSFGALICFDIINFTNSVSSEIHLRFFSLIMIPLTFLGYIFWKKKDEIYAFPAFDLVVIISLITTLISLFHGFVWTTQIILILSAILFMALSIILKRDLYIYLTTLCLGLSAYNSLIAVKDIFAIDFVVYALYTLFFIGAFFFLPVIKRILDFRGPRYMISTLNWKSIFLYGSILSVMTILFFFVYSLQLANFPGICTKCHFMKPYAEAWAHSTHKEVNCVDCHYEPGLKPVIRGKINGLVSLVKYVTHTYSIKPNSEINDASCLRRGCHDKMNLHNEIVYKSNIKFNHLHHLVTLRRDKQLRCTTCHSQIVQGEHLTVTESVCFTCHFFRRDSQGIGIGKCTSCHDYPPEPVFYQGIEFDHNSFLEGKPDTICIDCHSGVTQGNGEVPKERCFSCHTEKYPDLTDSESLHFEHITKRKVECFECHLDIKHGIMDMSGQIRWDCKGCHTIAHTVPEKMYLGIGAMEVSGEPDPMFLAKVSCQGCHKYRETIQIGGLYFDTTKANIKACDECHGLNTGYTDLAGDWQEEIRERLNSLLELRKDMEKPINDISEKDDQISNAFHKANVNLQFLQADGSNGIHNYQYTMELLDSIEDDLERCQSFLNRRDINFETNSNIIE